MKVPFTLFILSEFGNIQQFDTKFINIDYITIKNFFKNNIYSLQNINKNAADKAFKSEQRSALLARSKACDRLQTSAGSVSYSGFQWEF